MKIMIELETPEAERLIRLFEQMWLSPPAPVETAVVQPAEPPPLQVTKAKSSSARLPWNQFDELCKRELARLALDRRVPGYKLWDSERDQRLPTMVGVLNRYGVTTLGDLAEKVGLLPPITAEKRAP